MPTVLRQGELEFLAIVIPFSPMRPHFPGPAFYREGAAKRRATQKEIDRWIAYRHSKVRYILDHLGKTVTVMNSGGPSGLPAQGRYTGDHYVINCNPHWVTLQNVGTSALVTHPLGNISLKMNDGKPGQLLLLLTPY